MMQLYLLLFGVTITWSIPYPRWKDDQIIFYRQDYGRPDGYSFGYQTEQGSSRNEQAHYRTNARGIKYLEVTGSYGYMDDRGVPHYVAYVSDDKGYRLMKPLDVVKEHENFVFESKFQPVDKTHYDAKVYPKPQIGPKYTNTIDFDGIQFEDDQNINEPNTEASTESTIADDITPIDDDITTTTILPTPTNDTLLKVGEKAPTAEYDEEGVGNRVGLPPGLIGSLLGGG